MFAVLYRHNRINLPTKSRPLYVLSRFHSSINDQGTTIILCQRGQPSLSSWSTTPCNTRICRMGVNFSQWFWDNFRSFIARCQKRSICFSKRQFFVYLHCLRTETIALVSTKPVWQSLEFVLGSTRYSIRSINAHISP